MTNAKRMLVAILALACALALGGCGEASPLAHTPTATLPPTAILPPTATPTATVTPTPTPEPVALIQGAHLSYASLAGLVALDPAEADELLALAARQWDRELDLNGAASSGVAPAPGALDRLLMLLSLADASAVADGLVTFGAALGEPGTMGLYRVRLDELPGGGPELVAAGAMPQGLVVRRGAFLTVVGVHEGRALVCLSEDFSRATRYEGLAVRRLYLALLELASREPDGISLEALLGARYDADEGLIALAAEGRDWLWQPNALDAALWAQATQQAGLAWMDKNPKVDEYAQTNRWYENPVVPALPQELADKYQDQEMQFRLNTGTGLYEAVVVIDGNEQRLFEAKFVKTSLGFEKGEELFKGEWVWREIEYAAKLAKEQGAKELKGFEFDEEDGVLYYLDSDENRILKWNQDLQRLELVGLEGYRSLDLEKHRGYFVILTPDGLLVDPDGTVIETDKQKVAKLTTGKFLLQDFQAAQLVERVDMQKVNFGIIGVAGQEFKAPIDGKVETIAGVLGKDIKVIYLTSTNGREYEIRTKDIGKVTVRETYQTGDPLFIISDVTLDNLGSRGFYKGMAVVFASVGFSLDDIARTEDGRIILQPRVNSNDDRTEGGRFTQMIIIPDRKSPLLMPPLR